MDLDRLHSDRVDQVMKRWGEDDSVLDPANLFIHERVVDTITASKILLGSYDRNRVLASIPFAKTTYVVVCPRCIRKENFHEFKKIAKSGLIIPILTSNYKLYEQELVDFLLTTNHISAHEFHAYRFARIKEQAGRGICSHCAMKRVDEMVASIRRKKGAKGYREIIRQLGSNIYPFAYPDYTLLDQALSACNSQDFDQLKQLDRLGWSINSIRNAQTLDAPITIDEDSISNIPPGITTETDEAIRSLAELEELASRGLGLRFPVDIPLDRYLELAQDFQPTIEDAFLYSGAKEGDPPSALLERISSLNYEIERIQGLKRYVMLEATISFVQQNKSLLFTTILSGTLGLAGGLLGCAGGIAVGTSLKLAKSKGLKLPENEAANKLGRLISRDIRPHLSKLIASYVGSSPTAINVLSLRKKIESAKAA